MVSAESRIKCGRRHLESVSAAPYGSTFQHLLKSPIRIQPQLSGKGVLGHSPKRILVPFVRTKGTPRRRAVQALHPAKSSRRRRRLQTGPRRGGEIKPSHSLCRQPLSHGYAVPAPHTQGSLWGGAPPTGEMELLPFADNPSVSLTAHNSPCTGEAFLRKAKQTR